MLWGFLGRENDFPTAQRAVARLVYYYQAIFIRTHPPSPNSHLVPSRVRYPHTANPFFAPTMPKSAPTTPKCYNGPTARLLVYVSRTLVGLNFASVALWWYIGDVRFKHVSAYLTYVLVTIRVGCEVVVFRDRGGWETGKGLEKLAGGGRGEGGKGGASF